MKDLEVDLQGNEHTRFILIFIALFSLFFYSRICLPLSVSGSSVPRGLKINIFN
jgi:hypothetical protein